MLLKPCWKRQGFSHGPLTPQNELPEPKGKSLYCLLQAHQCPCSLPRKTKNRGAAFAKSKCDSSAQGGDWTFCR
jgi:hypothetical protein